MMRISQNRWWIYQQERFPVLANGVLIAVFSFSAVAYSALGRSEFPSLRAILVAFGTTFLFFLQLRIADEFKDYEEDCRFRSYRPVPRGLVTLRELLILGIVSGAVQLGLSLWLGGLGLLIFLGVAWLYLGLMSQEFFVRHWLKEHPLIYMWSHMVIMPLIYLYATACDWLVASAGPPQALYWFLLVSFFNGMVIEIGRKIRAPKDEEEGVETYSYLWGRRNAIFAWLIVCTQTAICAAMAAKYIDFFIPVAVTGILMLTGSGAIATRFGQHPVSKGGKKLELMSGLWTLSIYGSLSIVPLLLRMF